MNLNGSEFLRWTFYAGRLKRAIEEEQGKLITDPLGLT